MPSSSDKKEYSAGEHGTRALAGTAQGASSAIMTGVPSLGLLALAPYARKLVSDTSHVPAAFKTENLTGLHKLTKKLLEASGRNLDIEDVVIDLQPSPGYAQYTREFKPTGGRTTARDVFRLGLKSTPESIAHEVGHSSAKTRFGKALRKAAPHLQRKGLLALPSAIAATALLGKPGEDAPLISKAAPYVGGLQLAGILGEELRANLKASKLLKAIGYKSPLKQQLGRHLVSLSGLRHAALLVGAPLGILKGIEMYDKSQSRGDPITPKDLAGVLPTQYMNVPSLAEAKKKWSHLK